MLIFKHRVRSVSVGLTLTIAFQLTATPPRTMAGLRLIARSLLLAVVALAGLVHGAATEPKLKAGAAASCFPSAGFQMPSEVPKSTDGWWCDPGSEYAFMGFSYEVTACAFICCFCTSKGVTDPMATLLLQARAGRSSRGSLRTSRTLSRGATSVCMAHAIVKGSSKSCRCDIRSIMATDYVSST